MAEQFTFPQSGDADDAEHFASMIGQANLSDYVESGLTLQNYNAAGPDIDVTTGKCFISETSATASSSGDTILRTNNVVQIPATNALSLTDSAVNEIYVDGDLGVDDNGTVNATTGGVPAGALKIGEVDTTNDTVTEVNRDPTYVVDGITVNDEIISSSSTTLGGTIDLDGATNLNGALNITGGSIDLNGANDLIINDNVSSDIFTFDGSGDLIDGSSNIIYDQSNNWVPQERVEQGSGSGLDADTLDGDEKSTIIRRPIDYGDGSDGNITDPSDISGITYAQDFTITSGHTATVNGGIGIIMCTGTANIDGTINANGSGGSGGAGGNGAQSGSNGNNGDSGVISPVGTGGSGGIGDDGSGDGGAGGDGDTSSLISMRKLLDGSPNQVISSLETRDTGVLNIGAGGGGGGGGSEGINGTFGGDGNSPGGGGGAAQPEDSDGIGRDGGDGGNGGGGVLIIATNITGTGTITADGEDGIDGVDANFTDNAAGGGGGGGSGGFATIVGEDLSGESISLSAAAGLGGNGGSGTNNNDGGDGADGGPGVTSKVIVD